MCGRFALTATPDQTAAFMGVAELEDFPARYNIAPTQPVLIVTAAPPREPGSNLPDRMAMLARWGLIPGWTKNPADMPLLFNARSETASEKASFRTAMRHRRVLFPASGFYEWRKLPGNQRQAYWIRPRRGGLVAFGGLFEPYADAGGSEIDTAAILTTSANGEIADIHERMPVVIRPEDFARWLDCRTQEPRDVADLLRPVEPSFFEAIPVSDKVNKTANVGVELQERLVENPQPLAEKPAKPKNEASDSKQMTLF
ncbi:SOS response-associated peptidase [Oryzicola mucosus]|uniref:Abasic site processing protein n=1 Tax=Oryzicola mucosus TaxID=2767425 RepID=A0A8J6PX23_9HYPH|nr:SOS response-associated peptidase [Oryzicola mucosus]MBD0415823.1 SOS response-associated peptidase [Oryzicola mucosus]